ncbi:hypothetical protein QJS10_CPA02g00869 [Acorus calamus]|uniref:Uncharacterized protein n=1 Tax=Acorus calamus TaxID=4465 RepID=A0AAV9FEE4_ACOCL|nr:hypothetical protein QJS10_CPA02g00869 [Acorus calamus]
MAPNGPSKGAVLLTVLSSDDSDPMAPPLDTAALAMVKALPKSLPEGHMETTEVNAKASSVPKRGTVDSALLTLSSSSTKGAGDRRPPLLPSSEKGKGLLRGETLHSVSVLPAQGNGRLSRGNSRPPHPNPVVRKPLRKTSPSSPQIAPQSKSWVQLFPSSEKPPSNNVLEFINPELVEEKMVVACDEEDLRPMDDHWNLSLIGYIIGKKLISSLFSTFCIVFGGPRAIWRS